MTIFCFQRITVKLLSWEGKRVNKCSDKQFNEAIYICCLGVETWRTVNNNNHFPSIFSCLLCLPLLINKLLSDTRVCGYRRHLELELDFRNRQEIYRDWLDSL